MKSLSFFSPLSLFFFFFPLISTTCSEEPKEETLSLVSLLACLLTRLLACFGTRRRKKIPQAASDFNSYHVAQNQPRCFVFQGTQTRLLAILLERRERREAGGYKVGREWSEEKWAKSGSVLSLIKFSPHSVQHGTRLEESRV